MKNNNSSQDISWEEIEKYINQDIYQKFLHQIPLSAYRMALDKNERPRVIAAVMKVLQERDPQNATEAYALLMVDKMSEVAKKAITQNV